MAKDQPFPFVVHLFFAWFRLANQSRRKEKEFGQRKEKVVSSFNFDKWRRFHCYKKGIIYWKSFYKSINF